MLISKKPIERVNFSKIKKIVDLPDLIEVQKQSYADFLQQNTAPDKRIVQGLEEVFREIFPITDFNETSVLEYVSYSIEEPKYSPRESIDRNTNYAAPLKIKVRLANHDINEETGEKVTLSATESDVYLCDIPLMTERGTFVINGVERVIVSQLHRSPGIFFEDMTAAKSVTEKHLYSARIIPYRGSWIDFEFDSKNVMYVRIDKKKKIPVTVLLKALGLTDRDILNTYYKTETVMIEDEKFYKLFDCEKILGQKFSLPIYDENGEVLVKANHSVTKAARRKLGKSGITRFEISATDVKDCFFAHDVVNSDGEVLADANAPITDEVIERLINERIESFEILFIDRLNYDSAIRDILYVDKVKTKEEALIEIYKKLRPGEPATDDTAKAQFDNLFFNPKRYDLSKVGRVKINKRLKIDVPLDTITLTADDIVETVRILEKIRLGVERIDDIDHLGHRRVRAAGEQLQNHIRIGLARMEKTVKERMTLKILLRKICLTLSLFLHP